jgi:hypothetical protein
MVERNISVYWFLVFFLLVLTGEGNNKNSLENGDASPKYNQNRS